MGVPNSEVGYASAMPRREDHEIHKDMWGIGGKIIIIIIIKIIIINLNYLRSVWNDEPSDVRSMIK